VTRDARRRAGCWIDPELDMRFADAPHIENGGTETLSLDAWIRARKILHEVASARVQVERTKLTRLNI
jgi:hypothetical protein